MGPSVRFFDTSTAPTNVTASLQLSAQSRIPIQILEEARDAVQTLHVGPTFITTGSVDGHTRTYDLRKGELRSDFLGRGYTSSDVVAT
jgi:hypothetical protein